MITLLNTPRLTAYGGYYYSVLDLDEVQNMLKENEWQSAIGHESTAVVMSTLLGIEISANRIEVYQEPDEKFIIFQMNGRIPEGKILTIAEINEIGFTWGLLERTD